MGRLRVEPPVGSQRQPGIRSQRANRRSPFANVLGSDLMPRCTGSAAGTAQAPALEFRPAAVRSFPYIQAEQFPAQVGQDGRRLGPMFPVTRIAGPTNPTA